MTVALVGNQGALVHQTSEQISGIWPLYYTNREVTVTVEDGYLSTKTTQETVDKVKIFGYELFSTRHEPQVRSEAKSCVIS